MSEAIPLLVVTGYVGAGKTTLVSQWMVHPQFAEAALLVNVLDDAGVDRFLNQGSRGVSRTIAGGCACCTLRGRLSGALEELYLDRLHRRVARFDRIVVEVAGLADPAVLLDELTSTRFLRDNYQVEGIVTVVDAFEGDRQLAESREALAQVEVADVVVVSKVDLVGEEDLARVEKRIADANPWAALLRSSSGNVDPRRIAEAISATPGREERMLAAASAEHARGHGHGARAFVVGHPQPLDPETLRSRLEAFLERHGAKVLRMKGILPVAGQRGPALVQAVGGTMYPVRLLSTWPEGVSGVLAVVTQGVAEGDVRAILEESASAT